MDKPEVRTIPELIAEFDEFKSRIEVRCIYTKSARLQRESVEEIDRYVVRLKGFKAGAVKADSERDANILFFMQCYVRALQSILEVWIALKEDKPQPAWGHLVDAMEYRDVARKADPQPCIDHLDERINQMRTVLFPHWSMYFSSGHTETIGNCSICGRPFLECDHIEDFIYMGRLCRRIGRTAIKPDHMALVETPRDFRCVIAEMSNNEGQMVDYFTGETFVPALIPLEELQRKTTVMNDLSMEKSRWIILDTAFNKLDEAVIYANPEEAEKIMTKLKVQYG